MKTTKGMTGLVWWVIFVFGGTVLAAAPVAVLPENEIEEAVSEAETQGLTLAPLAFEGGSNTLYGSGAGNSLGDDDDFATFIGYQAGYNTLDGLGAAGKYNTFVGYQSGYYNTSGHENTFLGISSGYANTIGYYNTFVGCQAGALNTQGNYNTFLGHTAGYSNISGLRNTFLGYSAGYSNISGTSNTFLGHAAGNKTTLSNNTFVGYATGMENTTGTWNTFLGVQAGRSHTEGQFNTFVGGNAGFNNTTGNSNTIVGLDAGITNATGSGNVFLGYNAGYNETGSNRLYIDNSNTSAPLIYGEFDTNKLTINGNLEVIGPDNGLVRLSDVTTDSTNKVARMVVRHYNNAEEPVYLFGAASTTTANFVAFGGGATIGNAATQLDFFTAPNTTTPVGYPRLSIIGNGYVGIGTQTPGWMLHVNGTAAKPGGGSWTDSSDIRLKKSVRTIENALGKILTLRGVEFEWNGNERARLLPGTQMGMIAQEVETVFPQWVGTDGQGYKDLTIRGFEALTVEAMRELKAENEALKNRLSDLEKRLLLLERRVIVSK